MVQTTMDLLKPRTQSEKILALLKERGDHGATNVELNKIAFRYSARINDLRKDGHDISAAHIKGSSWKFTLKEIKS